MTPLIAFNGPMFTGTLNIMEPDKQFLQEWKGVIDREVNTVMRIPIKMLEFSSKQHGFIETIMVSVTPSEYMSLLHYSPLRLIQRTLQGTINGILKRITNGGQKGQC